MAIAYLFCRVGKIQRSTGIPVRFIIGIPQPADESARPYTASMVLAAATNNETVEAALAVLGADYYYSIRSGSVYPTSLPTHHPRWFVLSFAGMRNLSTTSSQWQRNLSSTRSRTSYSLLDAVNTYWEMRHCMIAARTKRSKFQSPRLHTLQKSWRRLVEEVVGATAQKRIPRIRKAAYHA